MPSPAQPSQPEKSDDVGWLRNRVAELEKQVSEGNRATLSLEESRALFDAFLTRTPAMAWMKDECGRYIFANRQFHELLGENGPACVGNTDLELWPPEIANRLRESDLKACGASEPEESVEVFPMPSGLRQLRVRRFPFRTRSGKQYVGGIALDVGAEPRSRQFFQSELVGVMECSNEIVTSANDTLLGWLGFTREDMEKSELNWRQITPAPYRVKDESAIEQLAARGSCAPYEKELLDSAGKPLPVIVAATAIDSARGSFVWLVLNLSERKDAESCLLRSQKLESLGLIAGGVAHDFNNLLATIMGNAGLSLGALSEDHPAARPLREIVIASRHASELTQQVLAYSGRAVFQVHSVNLSEMVREIGTLLETTISKKIDLKCDLPLDLPFIDADEGQLQQVIMNLVINASDAIGEKPGEIRVSTREIEDGRSVSFEVGDTGPGMSEATKARIFDPFFTTKANGRGLGLAAVLGIVRNHRGSLSIESELGVGTSFRVVFPASDTQPVQENPVHAYSQLRGTETVLVVDDDAAIRRMTQTALERLGYRVLLAASGEEGVQVFQNERSRIDLVLLDWAMPVMNGEEALRRILSIDPSARILMSSGYAETETLQKVGKRLLAGFVQKPYTTTQLATSLRHALDVGKAFPPARS